jgi:flagellar basal body rod protein FlgB
MQNCIDLADGHYKSKTTVQESMISEVKRIVPDNEANRQTYPDYRTNKVDFESPLQPL